MPILHSLPLTPVSGNRLLAAYHDGLRRHWGQFDQAVAKGLGMLGLRAGWSAAERRFLPASTRQSGLSMANRRGVHRLINPAGYPLRHNLLRNKAVFAAHVRAHGLPAPVTFDPSGDDLSVWVCRFPGIIAKRGYSSKGKGVTAVLREGDGWRASGTALNDASLMALLKRILARHGVVQELVAPHESLRQLSPGALPTLRVVTCLDEGGSPEACATILRLGGGGARPVDNFNAGGIAVRLDRDGRCELAFRASGGGAEELTAHPATGAAISSVEVPHFREAVGLALQAHRTLPSGYTVVGWDVGITTGGPLLIEANWNHGTDIVQLVGGQGLDRMRLGELYRHYLDRLPPEIWRAVRPIEW